MLSDERMLSTPRARIASRRLERHGYRGYRAVSGTLMPCGAPHPFSPARRVISIFTGDDRCHCTSRGGVLCAPQHRARPTYRTIRSTVRARARTCGCVQYAQNTSADFTGYFLRFSVFRYNGSRRTQRESLPTPSATNAFQTVASRPVHIWPQTFARVANTPSSLAALVRTLYAVVHGRTHIRSKSHAHTHTQACARVDGDDLAVCTHGARTLAANDEPHSGGVGPGEHRA
jgi:hypothetical protein